MPELNENDAAIASPRSPESRKDIYRAASAPVEVVRAEGDETEEEILHGYFSVFQNPYRISSFWEGDFYEVVERGAFARAINERGNSIRVLLEHGFDPQVGNKPLGKMRSISEDSKGGFYEADLYTDASYVRDLLPALRAGDYEASFRFRVREEEWNFEPERTTWNPEGLPIRTLKDVDVIEVGPALFGANPAATSGVRSMTDKYIPEKDLARAAQERSDESKHESTNEDMVEETPQSESTSEVIEPEVRTEEIAEVEETPVIDSNESTEDETRAEEFAKDNPTEDTTPMDTVNSREKGYNKMVMSYEERGARLEEIELRFAEIDELHPDGDFPEEVDSEYEALRTEETEHNEHRTKVEVRKAQIAARAQAGKVDRARPTGGANVTEPETYRKGGRTSYFKDLYRVTEKGDYEARDRLQRNDAEVRAGVTTVDGAGGEFVPPLWMISDFIELARAGRVTADQLAQEALPGGTDSINLPRIATGPSVAEQLPAAQNTAITEVDSTTDSVTANVATIAGGQTISVQNIEQSPINMDGILLRELAKDYAVKLDTFVLNNNTAGKVGLLNVVGANAVTFTTPVTVAGLYPKVADAIQQVHTNRFMSPDRILMHPRRWAWLTAAVDTAGRPLVVPAANAPQNVIAMAGGVAAEGFVGSMQGLPVFVDPNIPTNLGVGTNEDAIIVFKSDDSILFEGTPRAEAFRETKADTLSVYLRFYNYAALHASRYPASISRITGAGLVAPTF